MVRYVGLDVHRSVAQVCILDGQGKTVLEERFALTRARLLAFAKKRLQPEDQVVLEATTNTWEVVRLLAPFVTEVVTSNPLQTKAIAQAKVKTDKVDARVLAHLLRLDYLPRVWQPDEATQQLRQMCGRRAGLVSQQTAVKNRIHSVLAQRLIALPVSDLFGVKGREWLGRLELGAQDRLLVDSDLRVLECVQQEIAGLDDLLAAHAYEDEQVKLLMTLPGVNVTVAVSLKAALGDVARFAEPAQAASYLGLTPKVKQSAKKCYHGSITKCGNSLARWLIIQSAQHVARHQGPLGVFFRRIKKRKNHNVAVVAAARKLVVIAMHMLQKNEPYRYAQPRSTEEKLSKLRVKATGKKRKTGPRKGTAKAKTQTCEGDRTESQNPAGDRTESQNAEGKKTEVHNSNGKKSDSQNREDKRIESGDCGLHSQGEHPGDRGSRTGVRTRTIRSLAGVYESEGLPAMQPPPPGEAKTVTASGCEKYVATIGGEQKVQRRSKAKAKTELDGGKKANGRQKVTADASTDS